MTEKRKKTKVPSTSGSLLSKRTESPDGWLKRDYNTPVYSDDDDDDDDLGSLLTQSNGRTAVSNRTGVRNRTNDSNRTSVSNRTRVSNRASVSETPTERAVSPIRPRFPSGSRGKLGLVLERMHDGEILSQHDVASALRDYNMLMQKIADMERKLNVVKLHVPEEESTGIAPPGEKKITRDERAKLNEQIKRKDKLIAAYQERIQKLTHKTKIKAMNNVHVEELVPPERVIDNFIDLYEKEWFHAFETLKATWKDEDRTMFSLFRIVRHAYVFCYDMAEMQRTALEDYTARLQEIMLQPTFTHPVSKLKYKPSAEISVDNQRHLEIGRRLIFDYRNILVTQSITGIQELFRKVKLPEIFDSGFVTNAVKDYVNRTVELIWFMVVQDPPMVVYWLEPKQSVVKEYFKFYKEKRPFVRQTVWPAVFRQEGGALLSRGVVLAGKAEDFDED